MPDLQRRGEEIDGNTHLREGDRVSGADGNTPPRATAGENRKLQCAGFRVLLIATPSWMVREQSDIKCGG